MKKLTQQVLSTHKEAGRKWLNELPALVQILVEQWHLINLRECQNMSWNYVAMGAQSDREVVLKLSCDISALENEVAALKVFSTDACVEVISVDLARGAVLLEKAKPGIDLMSFEVNDRYRALGICCDMAQRIQRGQNPSTHSFKSVRELFENLEKEWNISERMLLMARRFRKELLSGFHETHVIHGDLHRGNILSHGTEWRVIDPKGFVGTLYNEIWPFVHDPGVELPWIASRIDLDEGQLIKWSFMHAMLATTWCIEDGIDPKDVFGLAEQIFDLVK